ncbi:hypothetical protein C3489_32485 [Streptomyces sp. Ru71]|uniref:hypothetical protein n=1 Tax=Streptomyces sp. Ru71 TaxID=2080746 RepID=UPI000CDD24B5|nr:hypothetical protein [Streptomyces sp. Ru71]POX46146.1 hypothetical protein C3489_32485 [Streptomyces sp. Ru71]
MTEIDYGRFHERLTAARDAGTEARWELLRGFQQEWGYEPSGVERSGLDEPDEDDLERIDPALPVPAALRAWWELPYNSFADQPRLYWTNPEWPPTLRPDPTGYGAAGALPADNAFVGPDEDLRMCVFMAENQYCNEWGYPAARAHLADPPVLVSARDDDGEKAWLLQSHSVSEFFLQLAVNRLPDHFGWTVCTNEFTPEVLDRLRTRLRPLGLLPWRELGSHSVYFGGPDVIVQHDTGYGDWEIVAHGRTEEALHRLAGTLGLDWSEEIGEPEAHGT